MRPSYTILQWSPALTADAVLAPYKLMLSAGCGCCLEDRM